MQSTGSILSPRIFVMSPKCFIFPNARPAR
nr:MAG TPA: hypothetical protein [Caudoviricetes sp.]